MENQLPIKIRNFDNEADNNLFYNSFLKSYRKSPETFLIGDSNYYSEFANIFKNILARSQIIVACNEDDENQIYGYCIFEKKPNLQILHYIYLKSTYQNMGIGKMLINTVFDKTLPIVFTFNLIKSPKNGGTQDFKFIYNPFLRVSK